MKTTEGLQRGNFIELSENSTIFEIVEIDQNGLTDTGEYTLDKFGNNYKILVYEKTQIQSN